MMDNRLISFNESRPGAGLPQPLEDRLGSLFGWGRHLTTEDDVSTLPPGAYTVTTGAIATALGMPVAQHGGISLFRWGAGNQGSGLVIFQTREAPSRMFTGIWSPVGEWQGWTTFVGDTGGGIEDSFYKGNLGQSSDFNALTTGLYTVETVGTASALGLPMAVHGTLFVARWLGSSAGIAIFDTRDNPSRRFIHSWHPDGTSQGWHEPQQPPQSQTTPRPPVSGRVDWLTLFEPGHGWITPETNSVAPQQDTEDYLAGAHSLKMAPAAGQADVLRSPALNLDLSGKILVFWVKYDEGEIFDGRTSGLVVKAVDSTGTYFRWRLIQPSGPTAHYKHGEWAQIRLVPDLSLGGVADTTDIQYLEIGTGESRITDPRTWHIQGVGLIDQDTRWPKGVVSITFDDGEKENLRAAREILTPRGIKATAYVMREHTIDPERPWYLGPADVVELYEQHGWTIGSHKLDRHLETSPEQLRTEWDADVAWFHEMGIPPAKHLAWTQGAYDETTVRVAREYFDTARSIVQGVEPLPTGDRFRIRAVTSVSDSGHNLAVNLAQTKIWIDRTVRSGGWLSIVFHTLTDTPTSQHESSFTFLADVADYILASGCEIATYDEMLPHLGH